MAKSTVKVHIGVSRGLQAQLESDEAAVSDLAKETGLKKVDIGKLKDFGIVVNGFSGEEFQFERFTAAVSKFFEAIAIRLGPLRCRSDEQPCIFE